mgnify:CR=1 FL=1
MNIMQTNIIIGENYFYGYFRSDNKDSESIKKENCDAKYIISISNGVVDLGGEDEAMIDVFKTEIDISNIYIYIVRDSIINFEIEKLRQIYDRIFIYLLTFINWNTCYFNRTFKIENKPIYALGNGDLEIFPNYSDGYNDYVDLIKIIKKLNSVIIECKLFDKRGKALDFFKTLDENKDNYYLIISNIGPNLKITDRSGCYRQHIDLKSGTLLHIGPNTIQECSVHLFGINNNQITMLKFN